MRFLRFWRLRSARGAPGLRHSSTNVEPQITNVGIGHGYSNVTPENSEKELKETLKRRQCVYAGFDPTADSLHCGNLKVLVNLVHWQRAGHQVVAVLGGATGMIGDPADGETNRPQLSDKAVERNLDGIRRDIETIFDNHAKYYYEGKRELLPPIVLNNMDWYKDMDIVSFAKDVAQHCRMEHLLNKTTKARQQTEGGMSFAEFMYQSFQAYDWVHLSRSLDCRFQVGGEDQLDNMAVGRELMARMEDKAAYGLTLPLLTAEGKRKLGKSTKNVVWLSPRKSTSFELYQFFMRSRDADVRMLLESFTFLGKQEIGLIVREHFLNPEKREAQRILARYVTRLCRGDEGLDEAKCASDLLYNMSINNLSEYPAEQLAKLLVGSKVVDVCAPLGLTIQDLSMKVGCFKTERDAERIIKAGGFYVNGAKATNSRELVVPKVHILKNNVTVLRVGKKTYYIVRWL